MRRNAPCGDRCHYPLPTKGRNVLGISHFYTCFGSYTHVIHAVQFFGAFFPPKGHPFKNIFDFTTAGDWDCVAAVERLPALHYSVDFIFLSFGIMGLIAEL